MSNIYITNDVITAKTLITAAYPPAAEGQVAMPTAKLPQNIVELQKLLAAFHVPADQINTNALITDQSAARELVRGRLLAAFPEIANVLNHEQLLALITAAIYQWANNYVPKTPVRA